MLDKLSNRGATSVTPDRFHDAQRAYMERFSDSVKREQTWRTMAIALAVGCAGLGWATYSLANRPANVPVFVKVDKLGAAASVGTADGLSQVTDVMRMYQITRFIEDSRSVYADVAAAKKIARQAYAVVAPGSAAFKVVDQNFRENPPLKRAQKEQVQAVVRNVMQISPDTWRVEWEELRTDRTGGQNATEYWTAVMTVEHRTPTTEVAIQANPIGMYIKDLSWSKRL